MKKLRNRTITNDFNIDLTYITDRLAVMGNPYNSDSVHKVRYFFDSHHGGHYKIINLSCEPEFNIEIDFDNVVSYPFNAKNPCSLQRIKNLCLELDNYLSINENNVVIIQCRTGKGRSCMIAACYLLHSNICQTAVNAISFICQKRTPQLLDAISVPSQLRYIHYYQKLLTTEQLRTETFKILRIRIHTIPVFSSSITAAGCYPSLTVSVLAQIIKNNDNISSSTAWYPKRICSQLHPIKSNENGKIRKYQSNLDSHADFFLKDENVLVRGDVCLSIFSQDQKISQLYFHTSFIGGNQLYFNQPLIEIANEDIYNLSFHKDYAIEILFAKVHDDREINFIRINDDAQLVSTSSQSSKATKEKDLEFCYSFGDTNIEESDEDDSIQ